MIEPSRHTEGGLLDLPNFQDDEELDEDTLESARPWWRRPQGIAVLCGLLIVVLLVAGFAFIRSRPKPITYQYANVSTGSLITTTSATGPVQSALYNVNFSGSGKIAQINVQMGQVVKAGQTLAKLDPTSLQDALNQAQIQADSAYDQEQQAINNCNNEAAKGNEPPDCIQLAENQYAAALAQLQTAQQNLANATLTAPHAGTITQINGTVGGTPGSSTSSSGSSSSSSSSGSTFIQIADLSSLQVMADVNEADIGTVAVNEPVTFTVSAYSNHVFRGTVASISPIGQSSSNVVTYPVTINLTTTTTTGNSGSSAANANAAGNFTLFPGMTANVTIITAQRTNVLLLPASALTFARTAANPANSILTTSRERAALVQARQMLNTFLTSTPTTQQDKPTATIVIERSNGKWIAKPVIVGLNNGASYEVLAGLSQGEQVVIGETGGTLATPATGSGTGGFGGGFGGGTGGGRGGTGGSGG